MEPLFPPHASAVQLERLNALFERQQQAFRRERFPTAVMRRANLQKLEQALLDNMEQLVAAVKSDFGHRSAVETRFMEIFPSVAEIREARRHVASWMKPRRAGVSFWFTPATNQVVPQPLGVVGIIVPWNYPIFLALGPLVAALAAGNRVMIKMSESTPHTGEALAALLAAHFDEDHVAVIHGGVDVAQAFSSKPFDHMLFTGSTQVGKHVMRAAADHLTPVTLELGGKSPVLISPDFPINTAAERILWGKTVNAGQTCVAPDYVMLPYRKEQEFVEQAKAAVARFFPTLAANEDYTAIIDARHHQRLMSYLEDAQAKGATIIPLNPANESLAGTGKIAPTLVLNATSDMLVMQQEIFGPILPVLTYRDMQESILYINDHPRPLALYYFDHHPSRVRKVVRETISGGVTVNDVVIHVGQGDLPFGGVGPSGMGHYHGKYGFDTFSKQKGVMYQSRLNTLWMLYPPYGKLAKWVFKAMTGRSYR
ncbi:acyl-CoA reductase-like NAD-dependent aldehyde dehydrogenase [Chitinivorax tropicus]|uniref:Aldehyde dehydrogenase n=1 Tax=Chitinivorax tropicus TaxID=714531 RepID=A0A840MLD4_9PROT|nr:coniferyl aldehyde dehydrogenase [Chitinivorax tropicus]MBB5016983.1 acyl-CoA reductase-like NAD-dependent aldehyde dehydrogenase [Chitinivorax tropicus]